MIHQQKAISPVVATALLLVVAVVAVVSFQGWFQVFSSQVFADGEEKSASVAGSSIVDIQGESLFFMNDLKRNVSIKKVMVNGQDCGISQNVSNGIQDLSLASCLGNASGRTEVVVVTEEGVAANEVYVSPTDTGSSSSSVFEDSFENWPSGTSDSAPEGWVVSGSNGADRSTTNVTKGTYSMFLDWGYGVNRTINFDGRDTLTIDYVVDMMPQGEYEWNLSIGNTRVHHVNVTESGTATVDVSSYSGDQMVSLMVTEAISVQPGYYMEVYVDNLTVS